MSEPVEQPPTPMAPGLQVLLWLVWVLEVIGFIYLFGCAVIFQVSGDLGRSEAAIVGLAIGLGVFLYGMWMSWKRTPAGDRRVLAGSALMLLALFLVFGACTLGLN